MGVRKRIWIPELVQVSQALRDEAFIPPEIRAVMGGNALRVIRAWQLPCAEWQAQWPAQWPAQGPAQGQAH